MSERIEDVNMYQLQKFNYMAMYNKRQTCGTEI